MTSYDAVRSALAELPRISRRVGTARKAQYRQRRNATGIDCADPRIQSDQRRKGFLGDPVDRQGGVVGLRVGDQSQRMHDIAERRRTHDQHVRQEVGTLHR